MFYISMSQQYFLGTLQGTSNGRMRVLVSAHTNVAVDRILLGLIESGFTDLLRIGSLPKISKQVLKYSIHCSDTGGSKTSCSITELKKMLKICIDKQEEIVLRYSYPCML